MDTPSSCKQGFLLVQAAFDCERKAKEEAHTAVAAADEAAACDKVGIQNIRPASNTNIANSCFCLQYS